MDRRDFFYRQKVLEDELDGAFDACERADKAIIDDLGLNRDVSVPDQYGGVAYGLTATIHTSTQLAVATGAGYDQDGRRVATTAQQVITCTKYGDTAIGTGGLPTGGDTDPFSGNTRWLTLFITFDRKTSDPRYDGYNHTVYFKSDESFYFTISAGVVRPIGSLTPSDKPARQSGKLLLCDVKLTNSGSLALSDLDISRMELLFRVAAPSGLQKAIARGQLRDVIKDLLIYYNDHASGLADKHGSLALTTDLSANKWANNYTGAAQAATTVDAGLKGIIYDLARSIAAIGDAGVDKIGSREKAGTLKTPTQASPLSYALGSLGDVLDALLDAVNGRVFRGGDDGVGELTPAADGALLGAASYSWTARIKDLFVKGAIGSNLVPDGDGTRNLGALASKWKAFIVSSTHLSPDANGTLNLGADLFRWCAGYINSLYAETAVISKSDSAPIVTVTNGGSGGAVKAATPTSPAIMANSLTYGTSSDAAGIIANYMSVDARDLFIMIPFTAFTSEPTYWVYNEPAGLWAALSTGGKILRGCYQLPAGSKCVNIMMDCTPSTATAMQLRAYKRSMPFPSIPSPPSFNLDSLNPTFGQSSGTSRQWVTFTAADNHTGFDPGASCSTSRTSFLEIHITSGAVGDWVAGVYVTARVASACGLSRAPVVPL